MVHKVVLPVEPISSGVVTPSESFIWEISRLIEAVAIFKDRATTTLTTARNAAVLQRTAEPGPSWCLYCTLKHLPLGARPTELGVVSHSAAEPLSCFIRRRFLICAPPPSPRAKPVPPEPLGPQGVTSHPLSTCRRLLSFPNS